MYGAHSDLSRVTDIVLSMIKECGMGEKLGQVYFAPKRHGQFLNSIQEAAAEYIDETARRIDEEVRRIIDEQYAVVLDTLDSNLDLLRKTVTTPC